MQISVERMIREGDISPLRWGMSAAELRPLLAGNPDFNWGTGRTGRHCLLDVDGLEFHFVERRQNLFLLVLKVWRLAPDAVSGCFDFGGLHPGLTLGQLRQELNRRGWPYELLYDPLNPAPPVLVLGRCVWCWFEGEEAAPLLQKITLAAPDTDQHLRGYGRLAPVVD